MRIFQQIDYLFFATGIFIFLIEVLGISSATNLNFHDTYLVISPLSTSVFLMMMFLLFGLIYFIFRKVKRPLKKRLGLLHYWITTATVFEFILSPLVFAHESRQGYSNPRMISFQVINLTITAVFILFLLVQFLFLINILRSLFRKKIS